MIERIGGLDDGFFMYFEDMDYCRRAAEAGFVVRMAPDARVVHLKGGTSPVQSQTAALARRPAYYYAARSRYFAKHYGRFGLWRANLGWHAGRVIGWLRETSGLAGAPRCAPGVPTELRRCEAPAAGASVSAARDVPRARSAPAHSGGRGSGEAWRHRR